jgi:leucyl aminopeptidase
MTNKHALIQPDKGQAAIPIHLVNKEGLPDFLRTLSAPQRAAIAAQKFEGAGYEYAIIPDGDSWFVVSGVANPGNLSSWCMAKLAEVLPAGTYRRAGAEPGPALFGWVTGQYRFDRYRSEPKPEGARVLLTGEAKAIEPALAEAEATALVRNLAGPDRGRGRGTGQGAQGRYPHHPGRHAGARVSDGPHGRPRRCAQPRPAHDRA